MFERFDEAARRALFFARYAATQRGSLSIDEAHLATGVLEVIDADVWAAFGATESADDVKKRLLAAHSPTKTSSLHEIPFGPGSKRALQTAADLADRLRHQWIGCAHLLAAVAVDANGSSASRTLRAAGFDPSRLDAAVAAHGPSVSRPITFSYREEARVERDELGDDRDLRVLCDTLFVATDRKDWTAARSVFVDGTFGADMTSLIGGEPVKMTADELIAGFRAGLHAGKTSHHLVANYLITTTGNHAEISANGYAWNRVAALAPDDLWETWGKYRFAAVRTAAGWRLNRFEYRSKLTRGNEAVRTHTIVGA